MVKKSHESDSKTCGSKRKKPASTESEVCTDQNMEIKVKKKRKKTELEEPPVPALTETKKTKKHKQQPEEPQKEKKKKKKKTKTPEPTIIPEEDGENVIEGEEDLSPEERRVLDRKMKKILKKEEKDKLKAEGKTEEKEEANKPIASQHALDYLTCWAERRQEWRFQKTRQTWLLQHMFDSDKVPDESFSVLLSYLEGLRGLARTMTIQKAEVLVREKVAVAEGEEGKKEEKDTQAQKKAERARELIQLLS